jgi:hypothetical protein
MRTNLLLLLVLIAACTDDTASVSTNNRSDTGTPISDMGLPDATDTATDVTNTGLVDGEACSLDTECLSGLCADLVCTAVSTCENQCGVACCTSDEACLFDTCTGLGADCSETVSCPLNEYCEPTVNRCVDKNANPNVCVFIPPVGVFNPTEAWSWTGSPDSPTYDQVMMMPSVANLTDDDGSGVIDLNDTPDIVFVTFQGSAYNADGVLRVISGDGTAEHWSSSTLPVPFFVRGGTIAALADIDDDGVVEILVSADPAAGGGLYAIENDGVIKWYQPLVPTLGALGPSVANVDGAGLPEIMTPNMVLSATGDVICNLPTSSSLPFAMDMDLDGVLEIVHGNTLYRMTNAAATDGTGCTEVRAGAPSGYTAVANLDDDPNPETVDVVGGEVVLWDHDGTEKWRFPIPLDEPRIQTLFGIDDCSVPFPEAGQACTSNAQCQSPLGRCSTGTCRLNSACIPGGGPPTIADFDGDGLADIAVAARWYYFVFRQDGSVLWAHSTKDYSSAVTGSSVFDFEGDGKAEVVYNDELFLRVYRGAGTGVDADGDGFNDADILIEIPNSSGTLLEYPLVVDVNNDGNAEIVVAANNYSTVGSTTKGIRVFADVSDNWVGTRRIWNQHAYHVTNINEDGTVPLNAKRNFEEPGLNNFRQNVQGDGLFNAPNLVPVIESVTADDCSTSPVVIRFQIRNEGSLGVRAGTVTTAVFVSRNGVETLAATVTNTKNLAPGASETFEVLWTPPESWAGQKFDVRIVTDDDGMGVQRHNECREDDNETTELQVLCKVPQ